MNVVILSVHDPICIAFFGLKCNASTLSRLTRFLRHVTRVHEYHANA